MILLYSESFYNDSVLSNRYDITHHFLSRSWRYNLFGKLSTYKQIIHEEKYQHQWHSCVKFCRKMICISLYSIFFVRPSMKLKSDFKSFDFWQWLIAKIVGLHDKLVKVRLSFNIWMFDIWGRSLSHSSLKSITIC